MTSEQAEAEFLLSGPHRVERPGYDGQAYAWYVGPHRVEVRFTDTLIQAEDARSPHAERAIQTLGRSEAIDFLSWHRPPEWIEFSTDDLPWIEGGEVDDDDWD